MKKRILALLLTVSMVLTLLPMGVLAAEAENGVCGDNVTWTVEDGILTISGTGPMYDYMGTEEDFAPWGVLTVEEVRVASGVTAIGSYAFCGIEARTVELPESVTAIGEGACAYCESLSGVTAPGAKVVGDGAFMGCPALTGVELPAAVDIGAAAFYGCEGLTKISLPSALAVGGMAFFSCSGLAEAALPKLAYGGEWAFAGSGLREVNFPSMTTVGEAAFWECSALTSVTLPNVITIRESAFGDCNALRSVSLGKSLARVEAVAFYVNSTLEVYYGGSSVDLSSVYVDIGNSALTGGNIHWNANISAPAVGKSPFTDVIDGTETGWYFAPVLWASAWGITTGATATEFRPDNSCTRAQAVTFLWRAAGQPKPAAENNPFTDVQPGEYYYDAVRWAVEQGITTGATATTFEPDSTCTRAQIVTFLYRAAGEPQEFSEDSFTDVRAEDYYYDAVRWAVKQEITNGTTKDTFEPDQNCTRGHIVTFLYRAK